MVIDTLDCDNQLDMHVQNHQSRALTPLGDTQRGGIYGR